MPTAATAGAISQTSGWSAPSLGQRADGQHHRGLPISHGSSSEGVVNSARASPGDRSSRAAVRSSRPG